MDNHISDLALDRKKLKAFLEGLYYVYARRELVYPDPLWYLYKYDDVRDREIVGLIASSLAYGRVAQIMKSVDRVLVCLGSRPREYLLKHGDSDIVPSSFKHRFTTSEDMNNFLRNIRGVVMEYDTIENFAVECKKAALKDFAVSSDEATSRGFATASHEATSRGFAIDSNEATPKSFVRGSQEATSGDFVRGSNEAMPESFARGTNEGASRGFAVGSKEVSRELRLSWQRQFTTRLTRYSLPKSFSLLSPPSATSSGKRLSLYLRWLIRCNDVDPGGWPAFSPTELLVPCDTHMLRIAQILQLTARRSNDMQTAEQITHQFSQVSPTDPVKYDFVLTRFGIRTGLPLALY